MYWFPQALWNKYFTADGADYADYADKNLLVKPSSRAIADEKRKL